MPLPAVTLCFPRLVLGSSPSGTGDSRDTGLSDGVIELEVLRDLQYQKYMELNNGEQLSNVLHVISAAPTSNNVLHVVV